MMRIPITITCACDTRRSGRSLDFGHGWTVDDQNVRLHDSRQLGLGWRVEQSGSGLFPNWCVRPQGSPMVVVTLHDGSVEKFRAKAMPEYRFLAPPSEVWLAFEPMAGTYSQLSQLQQCRLRDKAALTLRALHACAVIAFSTSGEACMLTCPYCRKPAMGAMTKLFLGPLRTVDCDRCRRSVAVSRWWSLLAYALAMPGGVMLFKYEDVEYRFVYVALFFLAAAFVQWALVPLVRAK